ncbi:hypothetical protein BC831DRAFT_549518 [Entophlyctis helioformis]|nr:hypothetical protein BC831DRAFT_549518 [Entophlyctis helioformis]
MTGPFSSTIVKGHITPMQSPASVANGIAAKYRQLLETASMDAHPEGPFTALGDIAASPVVCAFGVVTSFKPASKTKGPDFRSAMTITDPTLPVGMPGLTVLFFRPTAADLPVATIGQVVRVAIKVARLTDAARHRARWCPAPPDRVHRHNANARVRNRDRGQPDALAHEPRQAGTPVHTRNPAPSPGGRPCLPICDLQPNVFYDLYARVVAIVQPYTPHATNTVLAITDYTRNGSVRPQAATGQVRVPDMFPPTLSDGYILECTLWDANAPAAGKVRPGDYVHIRNMRTKINSFGFMEGVVNGDRVHTSKVNISVVSESDEAVQVISRRALVSDTRKTLLTQGDVLPMSTIRQIEEATNVPAKFRCHARVADFLPFDMRCFTCPTCTTCGASVGAAGEDVSAHRAHACKTCGNKGVEYQFRFSLMLADSTGHLPVIVAGADACHFLGGMAADNLANNDAAFEEMRSWLQVLWTSDSTKPQGRVAKAEPFDCMIEAYTVRGPKGAETRHRIFNTQIRK